MDEPDEDVLMVNQLVRAHIDESHQYECFVCPKNANFDDVDEHISNELHIRTLEQFYGTFKNSLYKINCRLCNEHVDWETLKAHGKSHLVVPWYEPEEKYPIFIENRIIACENEFYCCLCEIIFVDWSTAFLHIDDWPHRCLKEKELIPLADDFFTKIPANVSHESLVFEALVPVDDTMFECRICRNENVELTRIDQHVNGFLHNWYKVMFADKMRGEKTSKLPATIRKKCLFADSIYERFDTANTDQQQFHENSSRCYLEKLNEATLRCHFCDRTVFASRRNINIHAVGKFHEDSLMKKGCDRLALKDGNTYHCDCCHCDIVGLDEVYLHVKNLYHAVHTELSKIFSISKQNLLTTVADKVASPTRTETICEIVAANEQKSLLADESKIKVEPSKEPVPIIVQNVYRPVSHYYIRRPRPPKPLEPLFPNIVFKTIPSNYIKRGNLTDSRCVICRVELSSTAEIETHIVGSLHEISMKKYGCEVVTLVGGNLYYCRCCNCRIFGIENVYLHVNGRQHAIEWSLERKKLDEAKKPMQPEPTKVLLSTILTSEVTKMVEEVKSTEAANAAKSRQNGIRLCNPLKLIPEVLTHCNDCHILFTNCADLHAHLAGHFSGDFVRTKYQKKSTNPNRSPQSSKGITENPSSTEIEKNSNNQENGRSSDENLDNAKPAMCCEVYESDNASEGSRSDCRTPTKSIMQKIVKLANFDKDYIYDMEEKLREIELGMKFCLITETTEIYCLVCRKIVVNTLQNFFEHLRSLEHCDCLEKMEQDDKLFDCYPEQFSEIDLACEYMEEISDDTVRCLICRVNVENLDDEIRDHMVDKNHEKIRTEMHARAKDNFDSVKSRMHCDWYNVQKYWCVLCEALCDTETSFAKHLESWKHAMVVNQSDNAERSLIYDFCPPCALLWYGYRCTYAYHCKIASHKWLTQDGHYVLSELTELTKNHLASPKRYIDDAIESLNRGATKEREREQRLMQDLENAVKIRYYNAKAYGYGSRTSGLGGADSDVDIFLDCENMYNGNAISKSRVTSLMTDVDRCLSKNSQSWNLYELLTNCRTPIIRAHHRATGLSCDISFENGLSVEITKLIKSFNDVYPPCREMILFLKKWLSLCNLSGSDQISSYALCWSVIFYLQKEFILPSIATLTRMNSRSHEIAGWEVGITREYSYNKADSNFSIKELLVRYFTFYADFDFRRDVACPLLGGAIAKREFADYRNLPKEMRPYIEHMKKSGDQEPLRIDAPMCLQDPVDLQHNITKAVNKGCLSRFRICCSKSVDVLLGSS